MKQGKVNLKVRDLVNYVNKRLATSLNDDNIAREELIVLVENFLFSTDNYCGYQYLNETQVAEGFTCGVRHATGEVDFTNTDYTRRKYYVNH